METLKDIFVTYDIAVQLKEIGFNEPCIGYYEKDNPNVRLNEKTHGTIKHNGLLIYISAPTWEQVFKWFRYKGLECHQIYSTYDNPITYVLGVIDRNDKPINRLKYIYQSYGTYKQAQEQLILKLIEIYENGKKNR